MRAIFDAARVKARSLGVLQVVDCHAGGEPARVVVGGLPAVAGATMYEKRQATTRCSKSSVSREREI